MDAAIPGKGIEMTEQEKQVIKDHYEVARAFRIVAQRRIANNVEPVLARESYIEWEARFRALESLMAQLGIEADE